MANDVLAKMAVQITAQNAQFNKSLAQSQKTLANFTGNLSKMAGSIGLAFSVQQVAAFAVELSKLAGLADGVQAAFSKLPNSVKLLQDLKTATGGTVSELELMRRAVQASNFDISLQALPRLLEFAAVRAQQTGESVDYLVNSIVTGIGRKSPLILDNLGISSIELKKRLGDVSIAAADVGTVARVVGDIAEESLRKSGGLAETAAVKMQQLAASWENLKVAIGRNINEGGAGSGALNILIQGLEKLNEFIVESNLRQIQALSEGITQFGTSASFAGMSVEQIVASLQKLREARSKFRGNIEMWSLLNNVIQKGTEELRRFTNTSNTETSQALKSQEQNVTDLVAAWNKANSIFAKTFKASDQIKSKTGADFLFDSGALSEMANAGANALRTLDSALAVNSNAWDVWWSGVQARSQQAAEAFEVHQEKTMQLAQVSQTVGEQLGEVFGTIATNQQDLVRALAQSTQAIIELFLRQSIAAMIAASLKDPSTPFPFAKIALAAAGIGAVKALFSGLGASSSSGGSASGSPPGRTPSEVYGRARIHGYDLEITLDKNSYRRSRVG